MPAILPFPTAERRRRCAAALSLFPADVQPFSLKKYAGAVDRMARHLLSLQTRQKQSTTSVRHIEREWERLCDLGADEVAMERVVIEFAHAVSAMLGITIERDGAA